MIQTRTHQNPVCDLHTKWHMHASTINPRLSVPNNQTRNTTISDSNRYKQSHQPNTVTKSMKKIGSISMYHSPPAPWALGASTSVKISSSMRFLFDGGDRFPARRLQRHLPRSSVHTSAQASIHCFLSARSHHGLAFTWVRWSPKVSIACHLPRPSPSKSTKSADMPPS